MGGLSEGAAGMFLRIDLWTTLNALVKRTYLAIKESLFSRLSSTFVSRIFGSVFQSLLFVANFLPNVLKINGGKFIGKKFPSDTVLLLYVSVVFLRLAEDPQIYLASRKEIVTTGLEAWTPRPPSG